MATASDTGSISTPPFPRADLDHAIAAAPADWSLLARQRLLLTGATGFVGSWLLAVLLRADAEYGLGTSVSVLTRDPSAFAQRMPELALHPRVELLQGDVKDFVMDDTCEVLVHAAAHAPAGNTAADHTARGEADIAATRHILRVAEECRAARILFTSSGSVYGSRSATDPYVEESSFDSDHGLPPTASAYGTSKQVSEGLLQEFASSTGAHAAIARCFTFVGPWLPLDAGYAVGDFLGDALHGRIVRVAGDGTAVRSYLHAADLAAWLLTILTRGRSGTPYNVGSDVAVSVRELAELVAALPEPPLQVSVAAQPSPGTAPSRYVPSIERAHKELGLTVRIGLDDALRRTWEWLRTRGR